MSELSPYPPVGRCIYCGSAGGLKGLRDEHVVAFALHGQHILPKSTCAEWEKVTSAFEGRCSSTMYGSFRIRENVQTRRPKKRAKVWPMSSSTGQTLQMPVDAMIATLPLVHFLPPGYFRTPARKETGWTGATLEVKTDAPRNPDQWKEYPVPDLSVTQTFAVDALARTLAK